ncbi:MAG TPA: hypothetical protein VGG40_05645 [Solirubrobacterales bacterium]
MRYAKLGGTGTEVSVICLGCMGLADPAAGTHPWAAGWEGSREIVRLALEAGINFRTRGGLGFPRCSSQHVLQERPRAGDGRAPRGEEPGMKSYRMATGSCRRWRSDETAARRSLVDIPAGAKAA